MDIFISWSGVRSGAAAEALRDWLPKVINALRPWLSVADIEKGVRWGSEIAGKLQASKAGIICLTPDNLHSDWLLFESGALSKTIENTYVCPFLIGLEPTDVKPPLAQFQATRATKADVSKLLTTLNGALGANSLPTSHIDEAFEVWWPRLQEKLSHLPAEDVSVPYRSDRELLEEILAVVRAQSRTAAQELDFEFTPSRIKEMVNRQTFAVIGELDSARGGVSLVSPYDEKDLIYEVRRPDGKKYRVVIPSDFLPRHLSDFVRKQIPPVGEPAGVDHHAPNPMRNSGA